MRAIKTVGGKADRLTCHDSKLTHVDILDVGKREFDRAIDSWFF